jgi:hypothetical protein
MAELVGWRQLIGVTAISAGFTARKACPKGRISNPANRVFFL